MMASLDALKLRFRERCAHEMGLLQQALDTPEAISSTDLKSLVHQMAGAAGAFGFPQLSARAMRLDHQLTAGEPPSREHMQALIDELGNL